ncbi:hypothetical protein NC652_008845 [Populus alba x Populus x berolinensis]|nr:hypothetical protein NC652_008845 [Populus alba x Populus x berolinensis]
MKPSCTSKEVAPSHKGSLLQRLDMLSLPKSVSPNGTRVASAITESDCPILFPSLDCQLFTQLFFISLTNSSSYSNESLHGNPAFESAAGEVNALSPW